MSIVPSSFVRMVPKFSKGNLHFSGKVEKTIELAMKERAAYSVMSEESPEERQLKTTLMAQVNERIANLIQTIYRNHT